MTEQYRTTRFAGDRFAGEATRFDVRTGLPIMVCRQISQTIFEIATSACAPANGSGSMSADISPQIETLLEIGAGTGEIGIHLSGLARQYTGIDLSQPMLAQFAQRLATAQIDCSEAGLTLIHADGAQPWPVADRSIRVLFSSRTLHLLAISHVVHEFQRVAAPNGAYLFVGRVARDPNSVKQQMRQKMQQLLGQTGQRGRRGEIHRQDLLDALCARGAERLSSIVVGTWPVAHAPQESLAAWMGKPGMAGIEVDSNVKQRVLAELTDWAVAEFGTLDAQIPSEERYVLEGVYYRTG